MLKAILLITLLALTSCASQNPDVQARTLLDRLEFGDDEEGCFRLSGQLDLNPIPFMTSNVNLNLVKKKGDTAPDC